MDSQQHSTANATIGSLAFDPRMDQLAALVNAQPDDRRETLLDDLEQQELTAVAQINEQLRKAIEKSGESFYALAKRSGVNAVVISRFASKERDLRLETAAKIAAALGLTLVPGAKK